MFEHYSVADLFANLYKKRKVNLLALLVLFALIAVPFTLKAVKNKVIYLKRVKFGNLTLDGMVPGEVKEIKREDIII